MRKIVWEDFGGVGGTSARAEMNGTALSNLCYADQCLRLIKRKKEHSIELTVLRRHKG